jgi:hypothetical protein
MPTKHTSCNKKFPKIKHKKLKLRLKNTITVKTSTYSSENWTLTKRDRKQTFLKIKFIGEF